MQQNYNNFRIHFREGVYMKKRSFAKRNSGELCASSLQINYELKFEYSTIWFENWFSFQIHTSNRSVVLFNLS